MLTGEMLAIALVVLLAVCGVRTVGHGFKSMVHHVAPHHHHRAKQPKNGMGSPGEAHPGKLTRGSEGHSI